VNGWFWAWAGACSGTSESANDAGIQDRGEKGRDGVDDGVDDGLGPAGDVCRIRRGIYELGGQRISEDIDGKSDRGCSRSNDVLFSRTKFAGDSSFETMTSMVGVAEREVSIRRTY
jgi:hypothetical protein